MKHPTVEECQAAYDAARKQERDVEADIRREADEAARQVRERRRSELSAAQAIRHACEVDLRDAKDRVPDHPWTGKRVYRMELERGSWARNYHRIEGVVEMRRSDTVFPSNLGVYSIPAMGEPFVRLLNKDGKPGLKIISRDSGSLRDWKLVEEETARTDG